MKKKRLLLNQGYFYPLFLLTFLVLTSGKNDAVSQNSASNTLDSLIFANMEAIDADSIKNTIIQLQEHETRFMIAPNRRQVASWIQERFESVGCETTRIDSFQTHTIIQYPNFTFDTTTWQYNVSAILQGSENPEMITIIGGHYDCMTQDDPMNLAPGADDNGASIAAIIELARVMNSNNYHPNKTIQFTAFGAEELMHFSTQTGAGDMATKCAQNGDNLLLFINNDMIAYEPEATNWQFELFVHEMDAWSTQLTVDLSLEYTDLDPIVSSYGASKTDDLPFGDEGFNTVFFMEHHFNPNYHTVNDVVDNCNMDYCREIAKLDMALLLSVSERPCLVDQFELNSLDDGQTLEARWIQGDENDIESFKVSFGPDPDNPAEVIYTSETSLLFSGLETGTTYFASISSINQDGNESIPVVDYAKPAIVTLDQGILVVAGTEGGLLDPLLEDIEIFYDSICRNYVHELYDASAADEISLGHIGKFSSLIWHTENFEEISDLFSSHSNVFRNYLYLGGNILLTGFRPARIFGEYEYPAKPKSGSLLYNYFHVAECTNEAAHLFSGALGSNSTWPTIGVDSIKMPAFNYHLPWVEVFSPTDNGEVIYRYDTKYDSASTQGSYYNQAVGITRSGENKQTVLLGFPLYYMNLDESSQLIYRVMTGLFGEEYLQVDELASGENGFRVSMYPNPTDSKIWFEYSLSDDREIEIQLLDATGRIVKEFRLNQKGMQTFELDVSAYPSGMYFCIAHTGNSIQSDKIIINR